MADWKVAVRTCAPVPRASVALAAASSTAPSASLPARVHHHHDIEDAPPAKRICRGRGTRHGSPRGMYLPYILRMQIPEFRASRLHPDFPPSQARLNNFTSPPQIPRLTNKPSVSASWCSAPRFLASNEDPIFRPSAFTFTLPSNVHTATATLTATSCHCGCRTDTGPTRPREASESTL
ncbi:hypothetical protein EDB85DRAFT_244594 [Lactarius pseudohatsudake]|nr:hypothetical protein EDB85DRAFT_244594 [Lactarius pseudohatsudake]